MKRSLVRSADHLRACSGFARLLYRRFLLRFGQSLLVWTMRPSRGLFEVAHRMLNNREDGRGLDFDESLQRKIDREDALYLVCLGCFSDMVARVAEASGQTVEDVNARMRWMVLTRETIPQELFAHVLTGIGEDP